MIFACRPEVQELLFHFWWGLHVRKQKTSKFIWRSAHAQGKKQVTAEKGELTCSLMYGFQLFCIKFKPSFKSISPWAFWSPLALKISVPILTGPVLWNLGISHYYKKSTNTVLKVVASKLPMHVKGQTSLNTTNLEPKPQKSCWD